MIDDLSEWRGRVTVTVPETAQILGIGRNSAYEAARRGELPIIKIGSRLLVIVAGLRRLVGEDDGADGES